MDTLVLATKLLFSPSMIFNFQYESVIETIGSINSKGGVVINGAQLRYNDHVFDILPKSKTKACFDNI